MKIPIYVLGCLCFVVPYAAADTQEPAQPLHISVVHVGSDDHSHFLLDELEKVTFDGDEMVVHHSEGETRFNLGDIDRLAFDLDMTQGVDMVTELCDDIKVELFGGVFKATAADNFPLLVDVYTSGGQLVAHRSGKGFVSVDFNDKAQGIYIIRVNDKTIKFRR